MSALPVPPLYDEPPEEPVRRAEWKRVVAWIGTGLAILAVLLVVAVLVLLHSSRGHRYVLRVAQEKASAAQLVMATGIATLSHVLTRSPAQTYHGM